MTSAPHPSSLVPAGRVTAAAEGGLHNFAPQGHGRIATVRRRRQFPPLLFPKLPWQFPDSGLQRGKEQDRTNAAATHGKEPSPLHREMWVYAYVYVRVCLYVP